MKRILYIFDRVTHYNRELFMHLEPSLKSRGMELFLLSGYSEKDEIGRTRISDKAIDNEEKFLYKEYRLRSFTFRYQHGVLDSIREIKPDIVVMASHVGNATIWQIMRLKKQLEFKLVAWQCGYEFNPGRLKDYILRKFISGFDYHLAYHINSKRYAMKYGAEEKQITVIHNTINNNKVKRIGKSEARKLVSEAYPQIGERQVILYVGAILKEKRLDVLCDVMHRMQQENSLLLIVGDGPYLPELKSAYDAQENIIFTGSIIEGVGVYFDTANVFVLPGTGGLSINEAMAHALPVISGYADGSADDLVIEDKNGYRLRVGNDEELAQAIKKILADPVRAEEMGQASAHAIMTKFSFDRYIERIADALEQL